MIANILIVEDEILVALDLEAALEDGGYNVLAIAPDLPTAESYCDKPIDLALVDLNLRDGLTGPAIGLRLAEQGVAVLFVTANPNLLGQGVAGAIGVITKPTDRHTVRAAVEYALAKRTGVRAPAPPSLKLFG